jgi:hypothetical protein
VRCCLGGVILKSDVLNIVVVLEIEVEVVAVVVVVSVVAVVELMVGVFVFKPTTAGDNSAEKNDTPRAVGTATSVMR